MIRRYSKSTEEKIETQPVYTYIERLGSIGSISKFLRTVHPDDMIQVWRGFDFNDEFGESEYEVYLRSLSPDRYVRTK